jgi:hypothetical protein
VHLHVPGPGGWAGQARVRGLRARRDAAGVSQAWGRSYDDFLPIFTKMELFAKTIGNTLPNPCYDYIFNVYGLLYFESIMTFLQHHTNLWCIGWILCISVLEKKFYAILRNVMKL